MEVKVIAKPNVIHLIKHLSIGDPFVFKGVPYMKLDTCHDRYDCIQNAVNLQTGQFVYIRCHVQIQIPESYSVEFKV